MHYAVVTGDPGTRLGLHAQLPVGCESSIGGEKCESKGYLVQGDTVAVGKTCGDWSDVQFIGNKVVSYGWVATASLRDATANDASEAVGHLQRLNQTHYDLPPFCERPENTTVPGFSRLDRIWFPTEEITRMFAETNNFIDGQPPDAGWPPPFPPSAKLTSYGFRPLIAIENDGTPQNVVLWNLDNRGHPECNSTLGPIPAPRRSFQVALILSNDGRRIDKVRTNRVFGQPSAGPPLPGSAEQYMRNDGYAHLGNTYGIFKYRGVFYFDTFFDNGPHGLEHIANATSADILENKLGVFANRGHRTAEICEYLVDQ